LFEIIIFSIKISVCTGTQKTTFHEAVGHRLVLSLDF